MSKFFNANWHYRKKKTSPQRGDRVKYDKDKHTLVIQRYSKSKKKWVSLKAENRDSVYRIREQDDAKAAKYVVLIYTHRHAERLQDKEKGKGHIRWYELGGRSD